MRTFIIQLINGKEITLVTKNQEVQDILKAIKEEKSDYVLIEGHSAINKKHISAILDKSKVSV